MLIFCFACRKWAGFCSHSIQHFVDVSQLSPKQSLEFGQLLKVSGISAISGDLGLVPVVYYSSCAVKTQSVLKPEPKTTVHMSWCHM